MVFGFTGNWNHGASWPRTNDFFLEYAKLSFAGRGNVPSTAKCCVEH